MIQSLAANGPDAVQRRPFATEIAAPRTLVFDTQGLHLVDEVLAENLVTITQQITRRTVPWKGLAKLLGCPLCSWMSCHAEVENARRRSCASTRNTYRTWNRTVGTVKKSTDTKLRR